MEGSLNYLSYLFFSLDLHFLRKLSSKQNSIWISEEIIFLVLLSFSYRNGGTFVSAKIEMAILTSYALFGK